MKHPRIDAILSKCMPPAYSIHTFITATGLKNLKLWRSKWIPNDLDFAMTKDCENLFTSHCHDEYVVSSKFP